MGMKRARRVDGNQAEIVEALRKAGCSVEILAEVGDGVPDLLVGRQGVNYLLEVKRPFEHLNAMQLLWHGAWNGRASVVWDVEQALKVVGLRL